MACHLIGQGNNLGRNLADVTKRGRDEWFTRWLRLPEMMFGSDAIAKAMLKEYGDVRMAMQISANGGSRYDE